MAAKSLSTGQKGIGTVRGGIWSAEGCFLSWHMEEGERYLEEALSQVQDTLQQPPEPARDSAARYFGACALAVA